MCIPGSHIKPHSKESHFRILEREFPGIGNVLFLKLSNQYRNYFYLNLHTSQMLTYTFVASVIKRRKKLVIATGESSSPLPYLVFIALGKLSASCVIVVGNLKTNLFPGKKGQKLTSF